MKKYILILIIILFSSFILYSHLYSKESLKEASYYNKLDNKQVQCALCPRRCVIDNKKRGFCGVRENQDGILNTLVYGEPCALHIDPIEKKPLFHFLPASRAYSIATVGCNLRCKFCQNWQISQAKPEEVEALHLTPQQIIDEVIKSNSPVIAYTYTEPTIFFEYMLDIAKLAKENGIKNVMHSSGFINEIPLRELCRYLDAANIDLKGFSQDYYGTMTLGTLDDILRSLKILKDEGVHLEITNLVLPGLNDSDKEIEGMCSWIYVNLGADTPLHLSRFTPMYKMTMLSPTPVKTLEKARDIALKVGLKYVYIGNVVGHESESTYCPKCKKVLIRRSGYTILENNIKDRKCKFCGEEIYGVW